MRKLRFATAIPDFSRRKGGAERYLFDLCSRLISEGFEVHVYAEHWEEDVPGITLHRVKTIPFPKSLRLLSFAMKATKKMKKGNYDVTLGVGNTLEADVLQPHGGVHWAWFWRSLKAYDHPIVWLIKFLGRIVSPKQWAQAYIESAPFRKKAFKKVVAISDMVKKDIMKWYKVPEDQIEVIYNGVDTERFHPRNRQYREEIRRRHGIGDEFVILFVSNNFQMKGLSFLIKALAEIKKGNHPPLRLLILGRDRQAPYLRLAKKMGIAHEVVFAGSTDEPEKYYGAADLLVHPSFYDACSLTVLEALTSELPVITTASNGASGIVSHRDDCCVLSNVRHASELQDTIKFFLLGEMERGYLSESGDAKAPYSHETNFERMIRVFREVAKFRGGND